jgi:microcystin-dependent protein
MSEPFVGEIRMFPYTFAPLDWAYCDGKLLSIAQNQVLYAVIGTTYGGDGVSNFALPNLQGKVPMHAGQGPGLSPRVVSQSGGSYGVALTELNMRT